MARNSRQLTAALAAGFVLAAGGAWAQSAPASDKSARGKTQYNFGPCAPIQYQFGQPGGIQYTFPSGPPASANGEPGGKPVAPFTGPAPGCATIPPDEFANNPGGGGPDVFGTDGRPPGWEVFGSRGGGRPPSGKSQRPQIPPVNPGSNRPPRPPRSTSCSGPWIRTMHDLDSVVFDGYKTQPILLAAVCNWPNTWLVTLSGYQTYVVWWACVWTPWDCAGKYGQLTGLEEVFATSLGMEDNYSFALVQHLRTKQVPAQASIILAGHSLGGMVAQSLPVNPALGFSGRWRARRVLTLGAPVMYQQNLPPGVVRRFAVQGSVLGIPQNLLVDPVVERAPEWIKRLQLPTRVPFDYPTSQNMTLVGVTGEWLWPSLHVSYPKSADLKGFDALGYAPGATYLELDATRMWRLPVGSPFAVAPPGPERGLPQADDTFLQNFARSNKLVVIVRDANPWAVRNHWIGKPGYAPKPMEVKAKTLKPGECADSLLGLAAARDAAESAYYVGLGFLVAGADKCFVLSSKTGTRYYSDADLHGVYRSWLPGVGAVDQWLVDSTGLVRTLNRSLSDELIQHGPQDDWDKRNSASVVFNHQLIPNGAYGPLPPATAYLPEGGTAHLETVSQLKEFYLSRGIDWLKIYPNPDEQYGGSHEP